MVSDFQSMALSVSDAPLQKRVAYAEKMRKVRRSDILKGKRDELKKKAVDLNASNDEKAEEVEQEGERRRGGYKRLRATSIFDL